METCSVPALDRASIEAFVGALARAPSPVCVLVTHELTKKIQTTWSSISNGHGVAGKALPPRSRAVISIYLHDPRSRAQPRAMAKQAKIAARKRRLLIAITCSRRRSRHRGYQVRSEALIGSLTDKERDPRFRIAQIRN